MPRLLEQLKIQQGIAPAKPYPGLMNTIPWGLLGGWAKDNLARLDRWENKLGKSQRQDYRKLLNLVGDKKLKGLRDYVKKYGATGLPAIAALGVFGASAGRQDER